jgi:hypothetical protein
VGTNQGVLQVIEDIELDGIDTRDAPDFCDAFIVSASRDGKPLTETELDALNEDSDFVYQCVINHLY